MSQHENRLPTNILNSIKALGNSLSLKSLNEKKQALFALSLSMYDRQIKQEIILKIVSIFHTLIDSQLKMPSTLPGGSRKTKKTRKTSKVSKKTKPSKKKTKAYRKQKRSKTRKKNLKQLTY